MKLVILILALAASACGRLPEASTLDAVAAPQAADAPAGYLFVAELRTHAEAEQNAPMGHFLPSRAQLLMIIDDGTVDVPVSVWSNTVNRDGSAWAADPASPLVLETVAASEKRATLYLKIPEGTQ